MNTGKEKFEFYRKWFSTLLNTEFMDLSYKDQDRFMSLVKAFSSNCERVHREAKGIKEKIIKIKVIRVEHSNADFYTIVGSAMDFQDIKMKFPSSVPEPAVGGSFECIIFSIDGETWFSSKTELITGRIKSNESKKSTRLVSEQGQVKTEPVMDGRGKNKGLYSPN